ncbi:bacteriocin-like protein [Chryseobacterium indologenes]|uniref:bacteriocin-like protein n=1 Tax=Chryseobacterium indologenes TaxID=253 RepID=UPI000A707828|nr:hypothetical protein [Chryseobacterium indologenes]
MKNLKKLSRESLRMLKGGITEECARIQAVSICYPIGGCPVNEICVRVCNKVCIL